MATYLEVTQLHPRGYPERIASDIANDPEALAYLGGVGGGGGELPDWWTVDSTPGSESVEFAEKPAESVTLS
jgi:hypothetical protein